MDKRKFPRLKFALLFNDALLPYFFSKGEIMDRLWEMFQFTPTNPSENQIPKNGQKVRISTPFGLFSAFCRHALKDFLMMRR